MNWIGISVLLFAGGFFLFALATVLYVSWRYAIMALSMDAALLREFKGTPLPVASQQQSVAAGIGTYGKPAKTDGGFYTMTDEEAYTQEQLAAAKSLFGPHTTEQDLIDHLRANAVGAETDKETKG